MSPKIAGIEPPDLGGAGGKAKSDAKGAIAWLKANWKYVLAVVVAAIPAAFLLFHKGTQQAVSSILPLGSSGGQDQSMPPVPATQPPPPARTTYHAPGEGGPPLSGKPCPPGMCGPGQPYCHPCAPGEQKTSKIVTAIGAWFHPAPGPSPFPGTKPLGVSRNGGSPTGTPAVPKKPRDSRLTPKTGKVSL